MPQQRLSEEKALGEAAEDEARVHRKRSDLEVPREVLDEEGVAVLEQDRRQNPSNDLSIQGSVQCSRFQSVTLIASRIRFRVLPNP